MTRAKTSKSTPSKNRKGQKKANTKIVWIPSDPELADAHEEAKARLEEVETRLRARPENALLMAQRDQLWEEVDQAGKALRESSIKFELRALGHKKYDALVDEYPVSDKFKEEIEAEGGDVKTFPWDPELFPVALVSRSLVTEEGEFDSLEEVAEWLNGDEWNAAEIQALFMAALEANTSRRIVQMGNGSRRTIS